MRSQYQVLVIPFRKVGTTAEFALFRREDDKNWQFIAGDGEDAETPLQAAIREAQEEGGIDPSSDFYLLKSVCSIPVKYFHAREEWPSDLLVIPEYSFAVDCNKEDIKLSDEHTDVYWGSYDEASFDARLGFEPDGALGVVRANKGWTSCVNQSK